MANVTIFLSYSHTNRKIVWKIATRLKVIYPIWIDKYNLKAGDDQDKEISNGINNATLFIPFISDNYCDSEACREEFSLAKKRKKLMLPIMLQRDSSNGIDLTLAKLTTFYAFKTPNVFDPWCEDLFQQLLNNIIDLIQENCAPKRLKDIFEGDLLRIKLKLFYNLSNHYKSVYSREDR
jgi:hypothetical protein